MLPLHPRTRAALDRATCDAFSAAGGVLIDPVGYLDMLMLERHAALIVTDSGGVQKEAFFNQVPCITLRDETEWTELVELGWNTLLAACARPRVCVNAPALLARDKASRPRPMVTAKRPN